MVSSHRWDSADLDQAVRAIRKQAALTPRIGLMTGTGLGDVADIMSVETAIDYRDIPHFPASTAPGHAGRLCFGRSGELPLVALQGRIHLYEGYPAGAVAFPVRILSALGVHTLIVFNAAGGLNERFDPGDIMLITDHLNLSGENPLVGPNEDRWGSRFPDMGRAYDRSLCKAVTAIAGKHRIPLRTGVYAGLKGPSLETPAEVRYLRAIGADAVGFSTVMETIAAVHAGIRVLGLSVITNVHNPANPDPVSVDEVIAVAGAAVPGLTVLIRDLLAEKSWR